MSRRRDGAFTAATGLLALVLIATPFGAVAQTTGLDAPGSELLDTVVCGGSHAAHNFEPAVLVPGQRRAVDYVRRVPVTFETATTVPAESERIRRDRRAAARGTMAAPPSLRLCDRHPASVSAERRIGAQHYRTSRISLQIRQ